MGNVSRPKDQGGLGIINTKVMNESLIVKWIWKIHTQPDAQWYKILKAKYLGKMVSLILLGPRVSVLEGVT